MGLIVRPTGGLVDLASGTLDFVTRYVSVSGHIVTFCQLSRNKYLLVSVEKHKLGALKSRTLGHHGL